MNLQPANRGHLPVYRSDEMHGRVLISNSVAIWKEISSWAQGSTKLVADLETSEVQKVQRNLENQNYPELANEFHLMKQINFPRIFCPI